MTKLRYPYVLPGSKPRLYKNFFSGAACKRMITSVKFKDTYPYDPAVVDIVEDYQQNEVVEYPAEYKEFGNVLYFLFQDRVPRPLFAPEAMTASDPPRYLKEYKVARYRPAVQGEIAPYLISDGKTEILGHYLKYVKMEDLSRVRRDYLSRAGSSGEVLYVFDWKTMSYIKKKVNVQYSWGRPDKYKDELEFQIVTTNTEDILEEL